MQAESRRGVRRDREAHADAILPTNLDLAALVLVGMAQGMVDSAFFCEGATAWPGLAEETCRVVLRYLLGHDATGPERVRGAFSSPLMRAASKTWKHAAQEAP